jgi:hypothetical protein
MVEGSVCPQKNPYTYIYEGDEDCLFLNVYTPQVRKTSLTHFGGRALNEEHTARKLP